MNTTVFRQRFGIAAVCLATTLAGACMTDRPQPAAAEYCTPQSGWHEGYSLNDDKHLCSGKAKADFEAAFALGQDYGEARHVYDMATLNGGFISPGEALQRANTAYTRDERAFYARFGVYPE